MIASPTHYLFQIVREGITFLACTQVEMPPLMGIEVLPCSDSKESESSAQIFSYCGS